MIVVVVKVPIRQHSLLIHSFASSTDFRCSSSFVRWEVTCDENHFLDGFFHCEERGWFRRLASLEAVAAPCRLAVREPTADGKQGSCWG